MLCRRPRLVSPADRGPLRVMFVITSMPVGGAETLLVNLIRRLDGSRFLPELCCLKELGPLGEVLAREIPTFDGLLRSKGDVRVLGRLKSLFRARRIDAVITVGAGDKMFWGRLAAWTAGVPVIASALHSTGWPDTIGRLNRLLTPLTDAFIGVAAAHRGHLIEREGFPEHKVRVIPNGVDADRFRRPADRLVARYALGLTATTPTVGIVAALRPEKNHELFLRAAAEVCKRVPEARFLVVGDGPERPRLEALAGQLGLLGQAGPGGQPSRDAAIRFLGTRDDIAELLSALDVFVLTSRMEANPVSILEAMAAGKPVIAPRVGSIEESVADGVTGYLTEPNQREPVVQRLCELLEQPELARSLGRAGQQAVVDNWSLQAMVSGYERLIYEIYSSKCSPVTQRPVAATNSGGPAALPASH